MPGVRQALTARDYVEFQDDMKEVSVCPQYGPPNTAQRRLVLVAAHLRTHVFAHRANKIRFFSSMATAGCHVTLEVPWDRFLHEPCWFLSLRAPRLALLPCLDAQKLFSDRSYRQP